MAEVIDMRGSWAANAARSKALHDARLQSHQAEAAALGQVSARRRKVRQSAGSEPPAETEQAE